MFRLSALFVLAALAATSSANAKDLYVNAATGNDSVSYSGNSASTPWRTLGRATWGNTSRGSVNTSEAARAGDNVIVAAGIYNTSEATNSRFDPIYNPVNSGTTSAPITFRAEGAVYLISTQSSGAQPIIGTLNRSNIVWDGFILEEANIPTRADTGPVVVWSSNNITIQNLDITGITSVGWTSYTNHNGIRVEGSRDSVIRNNRIRGVRNADDSRNGAGITLYTSNGIVIEHNEIFDSGAGIHVKGVNADSAPITVRYNLLHDITNEGINLSGVGTPNGQAGALVYQNVIYRSAHGVAFIGYDAVSPANIHVVNNTIYGCNRAFFIKPGSDGYRNVILKNNIAVQNQSAVNGDDFPPEALRDTGKLLFGYNLYFDNGAVASVGYSGYSLDSWRSNFGQDLQGSITMNPQFIGATNGDFRLSNTSPARDAGVDILNLQSRGTSASVTLGAYVIGDEDIGITDRPTPANPPHVAAPMPPSDLTVVQ